ncbi:hypothetical protein GIS00_19575 [Nakamurella sp. YIM 132087]|uniref:Uncharacterized protein n=2 Tax=Nakamurella alba TaxID=2665158 RepID=A0A7K1FSJ4_9ACTN|nr:hypothetical protein [Nakamurella alba]
MDKLIERALTVGVGDGAGEVQAVALAEVNRQVDALLGPRPVPGTPEHEAVADDGGRYERARQLLALRLTLQAGLDARWDVLALRRWGVTWELVGRAAGVSRQSAHERWSPWIREVLSRGGGELDALAAPDRADV